MRDIPPEVYTKTYKERNVDLTNNTIPDILKSNLDPKSYNQSKMPLMNSLLSLRQNPNSGPCNSSLGKEEIMSLAVNVLRLLVSNLKLQQELQRSHKHIVSTHFHSRRYLLIPLPEGSLTKNKTIQHGYQTIGPTSLSSANSLHHQIQTFLRKSPLNQNLALSPLVKRQSLRTELTDTSIPGEHDVILNEDKDNNKHLIRKKQINPIFKKESLTATTNGYVFAGKNSLRKDEHISKHGSNIKQHQKALDKTRIKFHPSS